MNDDSSTESDSLLISNDPQPPKDVDISQHTLKETPPGHPLEPGDTDGNVLGLTHSIEQLVERITELTNTTYGLRSEVLNLKSEVCLLKQAAFESAKVKWPMESRVSESVVNKNNKNTDISWERDKVTVKTTEPSPKLIRENIDIEMKDYSLKTEQLPDNFELLKKSFQNQIGIPLDSPQCMNIFNFDEKLIAKGFERVVITWQGMYWEHSKDDICFRN